MKKGKLFIFGLICLALITISGCKKKITDVTETGFGLFINDTTYTGSETPTLDVEYGKNWKNEIVVKAIFSDSTSSNVTDYSLDYDSSISDTPEIGTYLIQVSYKEYDKMTFTLNVTKNKLEKPSNKNGLVSYTGSDVTYIPSGYDQDTMTISDNVACEVGTYTATVSIKDKTHYEWSDGSSDDVSVSFEISAEVLNYNVRVDGDDITINHSDSSDSYQAVLTLASGSQYAIDQESGELYITYASVNSEGITYAITGTYKGSIVFEINEETEVTLELNGFTLTSDDACPLYVKTSGDFDISAKKATENFIYDKGAAREELSSAIYTECDLKLKGAGTLNVESDYNNGIHSKDDLKVQKLSLNVNSVDNALKGNDEVDIESGNLKLISRQGDGIKTSNTSLSSKGNQKGSVNITDGIIEIYAACDGIDAAYTLNISGGTITIYTDKYSSYSEEVTATSEETYYIRATNTTYKYSIMYFNSDSDYVWENSSSYETVDRGYTRYYYYPMAKHTGYEYLQVFVYSSSQTQGQSEDYFKTSGNMKLNNSYDSIAFNTSTGWGPGSSTNYTFSWTTYTTQQSGGQGGLGGWGGQGGGGMQEGNSDTGDYSTKGLKSDSEINITGGTITIKAYDDAIHTNSDVAMESGATVTANINISGGTLEIYSNDDGIHADNKLIISGGTINISNAYEGLEGAVVEIDGGNISLISTDDGINGTNTTGESIIFNGGYTYVYAGGDGIDSNSQTSYDGILFAGGHAVIISTGNSDSSIDSERGYKYTGGYILGIGRSGGMSSETTKSSPSISSIGKSTTMSLKANAYITVKDYVSVKMPVTISAIVVFLGDTSANISTSTSTSLDFTNTSVIWN